MAKRNKIDWEKGEKLWRLGQLTAAEIGRQLGCPTSTVTRHMEAYKVQRDLTDEVLRRTRNAIAIQCNPQATVEQVQVTEEDIQGAVNTNIALVMSHRADLSKMAELERKLIDELDGGPTKLYIAQYQGQIVKEEVALTVTEKSSTLVNLMSVRAKRIEKQRQAFGMKDEVATDNSGITVVISDVDSNI